jgi:hypothetical protein
MTNCRVCRREDVLGMKNAARRRRFPENKTIYLSVSAVAPATTGTSVGARCTGTGAAAPVVAATA